MYLALWAMAFVAPVLSLYARSVSDIHLAFEWHDVWFIWKRLVPFLLLFIVHNYLLAPLLVYRKKPVQYALITLTMLASFAFYQCSHRPMKPDFHPAEFRGGGAPPPFMEDRRPPLHQGAPPAIIGEHDAVAIIVLVLILGLNLGIKYFFKSQDDQRRFAALEKKNLEQQLEYLRYQVNPHFFMNTLNNIHALVDIDPEEAKEAIVELSKMMRYILYEGEIERIPLAKEMEFIKNYVALMRLRYTEKVKITLRATPLPMSPDVIVAPLLLVPIIENAFKHGVSYQTESYIDVNTVLEKDNIRFTCQNSKRKSRPSTDVKEGGVGLANVRKRMALIYGDAAKMNIHDTEYTYTIELIIPIERLKPELS